MKKFSKILLMFIMLSTVVIPTYATSVTEPTPATSVPLTTTNEHAVLEQRLAEIKAIDRSTLSATEKRQLKKELRQMKKALSGGVYISAGSLILILLLLVLLL